jgi:arsenite methyltransferase
MSTKPGYGIDAPKVIRNLFGIGLLLLVAAAVLHNLRIGFFFACALTGFVLVIEAFLMLAYALWGKMLHRDRMLALHAWRGDEQVLDVGTGRGLLLIGAAKRLGNSNAAGHATGIDIWNAEDLSGNTRTLTEQNIALEGVSEKCTLLSQAVQEMSSTDGAFDVVVSNLCLHNIYDQVSRRKACRQIARVLKPAGVAIISDYKKTGEYAREFREAGLVVDRKWPNLLTTFPPLTIVVARKP